MAAKDAVWLGKPVDVAGEDLCSVYTSRIGGTATLFRETADYSVFRCPKCNSMNAVSLLAQIYAPLDVYDRLLYVLTCSTCSTEQSTFCFALRSQNFNPSYKNASQTNDKGGCEDKRLLFEESADWGDGMDKGWDYDDKSVKSNMATEQRGNRSIVNEAIADDICSTEVPSSLAPPGLKPPIRGMRFPCFTLEVFEEPPKVKPKSAPFNIQLHEAQGKYGEDVVETTVLDEADEPLHEKLLRKYVERIGRVPSQCVRWGPSREPLQLSVISIVAPRCPYCGKKRRYELQLTSPIIYFLTRLNEEKKHSLHFGNVLVFTCSGNCNTEAYALEYCFVEGEI
ncbi:putative Programmed cell death protein 2, C-terminal putative domain containing protein [Trypanosoma cruzi]|nr:putative Programmed cell death protein 2, C-terminal putative domain containing protein [Trypanosoma cruzi]